MSRVLRLDTTAQAVPALYVRAVRRHHHLLLYVAVRAVQAIHVAAQAIAVAQAVREAVQAMAAARAVHVAVQALVAVQVAHVAVRPAVHAPVAGVDNDMNLKK